MRMSPPLMAQSWSWINQIADKKGIVCRNEGIDFVLSYVHIYAHIYHWIVMSATSLYLTKCNMSETFLFTTCLLHILLWADAERTNYQSENYYFWKLTLLCVKWFFKLIWLPHSQLLAIIKGAASFTWF